MKRFVYQFPQHANLKKKNDGYTPLHLAALNNHLDTVVFLVQQVRNYNYNELRSYVVN